MKTPPGIPFLDSDPAIATAAATAMRSLEDGVITTDDFQRTLAESEQRYRSLFEHMLEGVACCRMAFEDGEPKDFMYLAVNSAFERLTGLRGVTGKWVSEVIPGLRESDPEIFEAYGRVARTGNPARLERYVRALGMWFELSVYSPGPDLFVAVFDVVNDRKRTEEALRLSERRYRELVELMPDGVVAHRGGRFTFVNPAAVRMFGASSVTELVGRPMYERVHPDFRHDVRARVQNITEGRRAPALEETLIRMDGSQFQAEVTAMLLSPEGQGEVLAVVRDITDRRRAEEERGKLQQQLVQAQKMEAVGRLAGGVAHDFNNMLTVIQGYADSAVASLSPADPIHADLLEVQAAAARSAELTRQLLAFSRRQTISPRVLNLNEHLRAMNRLLTRILGEDIALTFTLSDDLWPVALDVSQVDQVVANLVVNSRDAMPNGGAVAVETANESLGEAQCRPYPGLAPGDYVRLSIGDTGCGMTPDVQAHMFEPFFTTKAEGHGTGLGLATVFGIVNQNQGAIAVTSEPGRGTVLSIYVPRHRGGLEPQPAAPEPATLRRGGETILLVEDEAQLRRLGRRLLQRLGYTVLDAASPGEAITICERHAGEIQMLLTDVVMPTMNGKELAARLVALRPGLRTLYMSGYTADTIAHRGVLGPGIDFLQKPFSSDSLACKVRDVLDRREGR